MHHFGYTLAGLAVIAIFAAAAGRFAWLSVKESEDPWRMVIKWIITGGAFGYLVTAALRFGPFAPMVAAVVGICLGIMWAPHLGALIAKPFTSLYDGGGVPDEVRPLYSIAEAKRKAGKYSEAAAAVRQQLERFPTDFQGWMILADIYASNLKDLPGAEECVQEILRHENHTPRNVAYALNRLADWRLAGSDRDSARQALEWIVQMFPESEFSNQASERIAHLTSAQMLAEKNERPVIAVPRVEGKLGLVGESVFIKPKEEEPADAAARLVKQLDEHPLDTHAREELARIYADFYQRLDLAADQLEQLINSPNQSQKHVTHWLNTLADLHIRLNADKPSAVAVLHRVIERFPGTAVAANAEKRIAYIDLELNKGSKSRTVPLGTYEQNLGLKGEFPKLGS